MHVLWPKMSQADFAAFEGLLGGRTVLVDGLYWIQVRPFFYRPLLLCKEHTAHSIRAPRTALLGGFQHAVHTGDTSNSFLNLLIFADANAYALDSLDYNRKRQVKKASKEFTIRRISDAAEFKTAAYPVYVSFVERTRYQHGSERKDQNRFNQWATDLFKLPNIMVLGGYRNGVLGGVSLSFLVEEILFYVTFFCDTTSMRLHISDLMLHFIREAATGQGISQILCGMYKGGSTLDEFYMLRGAKLIAKPAFFQVNPLAKLLLARFMPNQYRLLQGRFASAAPSTTPAASLGNAAHGQSARDKVSV